MERKNLEQVILAVIIPVLGLGLLYMRLKKGESPGQGYEGVPGMPGLEAKFAEDETIGTIPKPAGVPDVKYEGTTRDPLNDLLRAYLDELKLKERERQKKQPGGKKFISLPKLNIGGLIWDTDVPQAIINGKITKIGDTIEGVKVVGIEKTGITVMHQEEAVFIPKTDSTKLITQSSKGLHRFPIND